MLREPSGCFGISVKLSEYDEFGKTRKEGLLYTHPSLKIEKIMLKIWFLMSDNAIMTNNAFVQKTVKTDFSTIHLDL